MEYKSEINIPKTSSQLMSNNSIDLKISNYISNNTKPEKTIENKFLKRKKKDSKKMKRKIQKKSCLKIN